MKKQYVVVPEDVVYDSAKECADDPDNGFSKVLSAAEEYKEAGMTPVFLLDPTNMDLFVVAKETFLKKLN